MAEAATVAVDTTAELVRITASSENVSTSTLYELADARELVADLERAIDDLEDQDATAEVDQ